MKPGSITIIIILSFSVLITADKSLYNQKRYLQTPTAGDQLLLLGFERFSLGKQLGMNYYSYNIKFFPVFKKYGKIDTLNNYNVTVGLKFNNGTEKSETITCDKSTL